MQSQPIFSLSDGSKMPGIGFGTYANERTKGETYRAVECALQVGYRHLDCAWFYQNEDEVGDALKDFLATNPSVKRDDVFICTKVWPHLAQPEDVRWSIETSLKMLKLEYVDLFLVHWPLAFKKDSSNMPLLGPDGKYVLDKGLTENLEPTWRAMEKVQKDGLARSIGVSNWTVSGLEKLLKYADTKPTVNQIEIHPLLPNDELATYCKSQNILPVAYSPLGSQLQGASIEVGVITNKDLLALAERKNVTPAQVLIAWGLKRGYPVLPKSSNPGRIESNFNLVDLNEDDLAVVNKLAEGKSFRFVNLKNWFGYDLWPEEA